MHARLYRSLYRIRRLEEEVARAYPSDQIKSPVHLSIGQEAVSVGVCAALGPQDVVYGTYRGHALYLAKGGDLKRMVAELYGRATGCTKGKGGSMHLIDPEAGVMGASAVVGTTLANAAGHAYAFRYRRQDAVVASFFGDGATEEGAFAETLNFAALKRVPILFICENNQYAIHTHQSRRQATPDICARARAAGVPAERLDGNDLLGLVERAEAVVARLRAGAGPWFFEVRTYRWREHVGPGLDYHLGYRTEDEAEPWRAADPVRRLGEALEPAVRARIEREVAAEVAAAFAFAEASPFPEAEELARDVFKEEQHAAAPASSEAMKEWRSEGTRPRPPAQRALSYVEAVREATDQEMARDPAVVLFGLDVDDPKAIQGTTRGLAQKYGPGRVFGTPLSEDAMTGAAVGMALAGLRPIHVHIRMDFLMLAMNQLVNVAAKARYMYGGRVSVPLVVRCMIGKSWGQGAQHSQGLHSFFMHVPGLKVVAPATPYDAKGCLSAAVRDDDPVVYVEHRLLHPQKGPVPEAPYTVPPGKARVTAPGDDVTLVGISSMQGECLRARRYLEEVGLRAEVIDPIWLSPLDVDTIAESVERTGRLLVVDTAWLCCGAAAEVVAQVAERLQGARDLRLRRLGFAPVTCPTTPALEELFYPNARTIAAAARDLVEGAPTGWLPEHRPDLPGVEFKGPF
jgi:pyruvate/2-oxoglutarate/acetoin dehydrogenase E1 component/TPP-dependent pyruvate/acetoin dehydrogenase alpha subunit